MGLPPELEVLAVVIRKSGHGNMSKQCNHMQKVWAHIADHYWLALTFGPCVLTFAPCILTCAPCACGVSLQLVQSFHLDRCWVSPVATCSGGAFSSSHWRKHCTFTRSVNLHCVVVVNGIYIYNGIYTIDHHHTVQLVYIYTLVYIYIYAYIYVHTGER